MLRGNPRAFADVWLPEGSERPLAETVRRSASSNQAFAAEITSWRGGILVGKTAFKSPSRPTPRPLLLEALHAFMRSALVERLPFLLVRPEHIGSIPCARGSTRRACVLDGERNTDGHVGDLPVRHVARPHRHNPLDRLAKQEKPKQVASREPRGLSDSEVRALCAAATPRYRPIGTTLA